MSETIQARVTAGSATDVSTFPRTEGGDYLLPRLPGAAKWDFHELCDASAGAWIRCIGRRKSDGQLIASSSMRFAEDPELVAGPAAEFECEWTR